MATTEHNGLLTYVDTAGDKHLLYPITRTDLVDGLEELLGTKAPAGYGLGVARTETEVADCNDAVRNGWYITRSDSANSPMQLASWMRVDAYNENNLVQTWYNDEYGGIIAQRMKAGTWGEWEWVKYPMALGVEYRTTERYNGNAVYVQAINLGIPGANTTTVTIPTGRPIRSVALQNNGFALPYGGEDSSLYARVDVMTGSAKIVCGSQFHNSAGIIVIVWYTK